MRIATATLVAALAIACQPGGTTNLSGQVIVEDEAGSPPTCATSTAAGELCVEGDMEANGNLDIAGTSTLTGNATVGGTLGITGLTTFTGGITGNVVATGKIDATNLYTDTVTISNAELLNLRATPKTLVAAQGSNKVIELVSIVWHLNYGSAQCTESADNLDVKYVDASGTAIVTTIETTGSWLVAAADATGWTLPLATLLTASDAQIANVPIILDNNGDGEFGGCTGSTVTAFVTYRVHDIS